MKTRADNHRESQRFTQNCNHGLLITEFIIICALYDHTSILFLLVVVPFIFWRGGGRGIVSHLDLSIEQFLYSLVETHSLFECYVQYQEMSHNLNLIEG